STRSTLTIWLSVATRSCARVKSSTTQRGWARAVRSDNPFSLEAVATYGVTPRTSVDLKYMRDAEKELLDNLSAFPDPTLRYGGAIGLSGGHGSGKTHLLSWLAARPQPLRNIKPNVVYGKVDSTNPFDLYKQLVSQIKLPKLIQLINLATRNLALEEVKSSRATESIATRIGSPETLTPLYEETNLDREQLTNALEERLYSIAVPTTIPQVLLRVASP